MQLPVAVWVNQFQDAATAIFYDGHICNKSAVICAASADREFYMELTSNPLSPQLFEKLECLYRHGLTIVEVPDFWVNEASRPRGWREQLINLALDHVAKLPEPADPGKPALYDEALAHEVMTVLDMSYPHLVNIIDIKRGLVVEPGDNVLMTALEALSHEKKIDGAPKAGSMRKLSTAVRIRLTPQGRDVVRGINQKTPNVSVIHGDQNINYGHAGAVGRQSVGELNQSAWIALASQFDLLQVASELQTLKSELMKTAKTSADFQRLSLVAEAQQYAERQNGSKMIETLSRSGKWLFEFATHIGTDITAKLLAKAIGLEY